MSETSDIQTIFFQQLRDVLPKNLSLVDVIAEELKISDDSAYRRIRGEKQLTFTEVATLSNHFKISIDSLLNSAPDIIPFRSRLLGPSGYTLEEHMKNIIGILEMFDQFPDSETIYNAMNVPPFQTFMVPEVANFLMFFWQRSVGYFPEFENKKFSVSEKNQTLDLLKNKILTFYIKKPVTEIWGEETVNSILMQISFYHEARIFETKGDALTLLDKLSEMISHVQKQAECGHKFLYGTVPSGVEGNYKLYYNELALSDTTILQKGGDVRLVYIVYNTINFVVTTHPVFCENASECLKKLISKSTLISGASEKERNKIFFSLRDKITKLKSKIQAEE